MAKRGGGSGRKYVRDNRGRFSSTGATARGGRLKTASGKKRAAQTVKAKTGGKPAGAIKGKIKRDPGAAKPTAANSARATGKPAARTSKAPTNTISRSPRQLNKDEKIARDVMTDKRLKSDRQRITEMQRRGVKPNVDVIGLVAKVRSKQGGGTTGKIKPAAAKPAAARRADRAEANIPMKGRRGKQLDASISKAAKQVKAAETARLMKPKAQRKSERAAKAEAKRQVAAAKPKRVRSAESLRVSRAKRIAKERSISLNPAGNTQKGAGRMAANAKRTQDRALAFYKGKAKPKDGTDITREIGRAKANKRIKNLNQQIKEAGTNAAGLRLEKLKVQTRMPNKPRQRVQPTAKQSAKEASRNDAIRKRSAELRAQSGRLQRNQANIQRLKA